MWLTGVTALTVATATAAAAPPGPSRLAGADGSTSGSVAQTAAVTDPGPAKRQPGQPGKAPTPVAKVSLTEADSGKTITVKPGTEIDVALKPDTGDRWSQPRSSNPKSVSGGRGGRHFGRRGGQGQGPGGPGSGPGQPGQGPGLFPGRGGNGSTQAVFYAQQAGNANLTSAEGKRGFLLLMRQQQKPVKQWQVTVTVSGPAPAQPAPKPGTPAPKQPGTPPALVPPIPGTPTAPRAVTGTLVAPVTTAARHLLVSVSHF
jgi:hypothetical protein